MDGWMEGGREGGRRSMRVSLANFHRHWCLVRSLSPALVSRSLAAAEHSVAPALGVSQESIA
jgi:hypothetical protein